MIFALLRGSKLQNAEPEQASRKSGRPQKGEGPDVPWNEVDQLIVFGEKIVNENTGNTVIEYLSYRQIAERYGVAHSLVASYAKQHNCMRRRRENEGRIRIKAEEKLVEIRAEELTVSIEDALVIIDKGILEFGQALDEGRARVDTTGDLNTLLRLKQFLMGNADSRQEVLHGLSLEELQRRHKNMMQQGDDDEPSEENKPQEIIEEGEACTINKIDNDPPKRSFELSSEEVNAQLKTWSEPDETVKNLVTNASDVGQSAEHATKSIDGDVNKEENEPSDETNTEHDETSSCR